MEVRIGQETDGSYIAYNTTGKKTVMIGTGDTIEEAKEDFRNTIKEVKQTYIDRNEDIPQDLFEDLSFMMEEDENKN